MVYNSIYRNYSEFGSYKLKVGGYAMNKLFAAILTLALVALSAAAIHAGEAKDVITLPSKQGAVTLTHKAHVAHAQKKCNACHHLDKADGSDAKKCSQCHKEKESEVNGKKVISAKDAFHQNCKDCHKKDAAKKAPTTCKGCHVK